jgi:hypothetical protein
MDTHAIERRTSIGVDDSLWITLDRRERAGMQIVVIPNRAQALDESICVDPLCPVPDADDDLANATWEDAEWR